MLVSDKYKFYIACPTKTGTTTLQNMVGKYLTSGGDSNTLRLVSGLDGTKHRMAPPPGKQNFDRYMMVRNPYERLVSIYEWLRRKSIDEPIGAQIVNWEEAHGRKDGWRFMLHEFSAIRARADYHEPGARKWGGKRPFMWTDRLSELEDVVTGIDTDGGRLSWYTTRDVFPVQVEGIQQAWQEIMVRQGVEGIWLHNYQFPRLNSTKPENRLYADWREYYKEHRLLELAASLIGHDADWYSYEAL